MRILFGAWPAYGHLLPMVPVIRAAQRGGHDVMVSSGGDMSATIGRLGVQAHRSGLTLAESYARMPAHSTISELPPDEQPGFAARHLFGAGAVNRATCVLELLQTWLPDLVVHDRLELGTPTAAALHGIPHVTHGYGPMVPNTAYFAAAIGSAISAAGHGFDPLRRSLMGEQSASAGGFLGEGRFPPSPAVTGPGSHRSVGLPARHLAASPRLALG